MLQTTFNYVSAQILVGPTQGPARHSVLAPVKAGGESASVLTAKFLCQSSTLVVIGMGTADDTAQTITLGQLSFPTPFGARISMHRCCCGRAERGPQHRALQAPGELRGARGPRSAPVLQPGDPAPPAPGDDGPDHLVRDRPGTGNPPRGTAESWPAALRYKRTKGPSTPLNTPGTRHPEHPPPRHPKHL